MAVNQGIKQSIERAVSYLRKIQHRSGYWSDFHGRGRWGPTTSWSTGWVCNYLNPLPNFSSFGVRAIKMLRKTERRHGWGYNRFTPCDADSTSSVIAALSYHTSLNNSKLTKRWLDYLSYFETTDGFRTYPATLYVKIMATLSRSHGIQGWTLQQLDVSAAVLHTMIEAGLNDTQLFKRGLASLISNIREDSASYWWNSDVYLYSYLLRLAAKGIQLPNNCYEAYRNKLLQEINTGNLPPLYLGMALIALSEIREPKPLLREAIDWLINLQQPNGAWCSGPVLRIPSASDQKPWLRTEWKIDCPGPYALWSESHCCLSTAVAVRALWEYSNTLEGGV